MRSAGLEIGTRRPNLKPRVKTAECRLLIVFVDDPLNFGLGGRHKVA